MPGQHFRPPLPVGPRPQMVQGHPAQPGTENRTQMLLQQRQPPPNTVENVNQVREEEEHHGRIFHDNNVHREPVQAISWKEILTWG